MKRPLFRAQVKKTLQAERLSLPKQKATKTKKPMEKLRVLFVCMHNSARSQMAEGLLRAMAGDRYEVYSAGTEPRGVHPLAVRVMQQRGIDLSGHHAKHVDTFRDVPMDYVVTVCDAAREHCPYVPARRRNLHQSFPDPSAVEGDEATRLEAFRRVRDQIHAWLAETFGRQTPS